MNFRKLLVLLLIFAIAPMGAFALATPDLTGATFHDPDGTTIASDHYSGASLDVKHTVSRKSTFSVIEQTSTINETGETTIASISLKNNTGDGYTLAVSTLNDGILKPVSENDGEANIPYALHFNMTGTLGTGADLIGDTGIVTQSALSTESGNTNSVLVVDADSGASSPSEVKFSVDLSVADGEAAKMSMAGTYNDTITFVYTDK